MKTKIIMIVVLGYLLGFISIIPYINYKLRNHPVEKQDGFTVSEKQKQINHIKTIFKKYHTNLTEKELNDVANIIYEDCQKYGFSIEFILALIHTESHFNKNAKSKVGAIGLMQLMPVTGKAFAKDFGIIIKDDKKFYNPQLNVKIGMYYLYKLNQRFKDMNLVLACYNMGPSKAKKVKNLKRLSYIKKINKMVSLL